MSMQVKFTFSADLMEKNNIDRNDVYYTLKNHFSQRGLVCISENDVLAFGDTGKEDDFGNMWAIIVGLIRCDWFDKCASSCVFIEDDYEEDVLIQIPELRKIMASA